MRKMRARFRRRAAIEPRIGHLKKRLPTRPQPVAAPLRRACTRSLSGFSLPSTYVPSALARSAIGFSKDAYIHMASSGPGVSIISINSSRALCLPDTLG